MRASEDRAKNVWEIFLVLTLFIPLLAGRICGSELIHLLGFESLSLPEQWNGIQLKALLGQIASLPIVYLFVLLWGWMLRTTGLLSTNRASHFPFGARLS